MLFSSDGAALQRRGGIAAQAQPQLVPDARIRPFVQVLVRRALDVEAAQARRAHAEQREAPLGMAIDQLVRHRRRRGEDAEPGERVDALIDGQRVLRHARPADAVEAVAAADEVTRERLRLAVLAKADLRPVALEIVDAHVFGLEDDLAAGGEPGGDQVLGDLGLAVDGHGLAGERSEVDPVALAAEAELDAFVDQPEPAHPLADLRLLEQIDRALLEHAGADPPLDVLPAAPLQDDGLDALKMQELREQQARRPGPHDANLRAHPCGSSSRVRQLNTTAGP